MSIDFSKTQVVKKANPRVPEREAGEKLKGPRSPYQINLIPAKDRIKFSSFLFTELGLANNSLGNGTNPEVPGKMLLIVFPGNAGIWAKARGSRDKGRSFKNVKLIKGLRELGHKGDHFNLTYLGEGANAEKYYTFEEYVPAAETAASPAPVSAGSIAPAPKEKASAKAPVEATGEGEDRFN